MNNRALALDALRGYAIITMVLSATIVTHVLPGWMSHAQTPPPYHVFNPLLPGITWVDLVFPFFLFAMGAAFPFSIRKRAEKGDSKLKLVYEAVKRGIQLTFFAIFIQHFYPYMLSSPQDMRAKTSTSRTEGTDKNGEPIQQRDKQDRPKLPTENCRVQQ